MSKHKPAGKEKDLKEKDKGVQLVIRIAKSERAAFVALCEDLDTTAAREIRRFMREFVAAKAPVAPDDDAKPSQAADTVAEPAADPIAEPAPAPVAAEAPPPADPTPAAEVGTDATDTVKKPRKRAKA